MFDLTGGWRATLSSLTDVWITTIMNRLLFCLFFFFIKLRYFVDYLLQYMFDSHGGLR
jgi:hypothetical protein